jgi:uncharacterized RDD family membrane protein YckC
VSQDWDMSVRTAESVRLSYPLAGVGNRFLAAFLDVLFQSLLMVGLIILAGLLGAVVQPPREVGLVAVGLFILLLFGVFWGYYLLFEGAWNGQTPGKRVAGVRVVKDDGSPVDFFAVLVRNLVRIVDFLPGFYAIGTLSILLTRKGQRLGDLAAGTVVVKARTERDFQSLRTRALPAAGPVTVRALSGEAQRIVREFVQREGSMPEAAAAHLAQQIAAGIRPLVPESADFPEDVAFLYAVAAALRGTEPA